MMWAAWLIGMAHALPRTICVEAEVSYTDIDITNGTEDYFTNYNNRPLRGARLYYKAGAAPGYAIANVAFNGATPGCIVLNLDPALTYFFKVSSQATVRGHDIDVVSSVSGLPWEVEFPNETFPSPGVRTFVVNPTGANRGWNVLAASGFALYRRDGNLPSAYGVTFHLTNGAGTLSSPCGGTACISGTDIYLDDDLAYRKFEIAYALGRTFLNYLAPATGLDLDKSASNAHCGTTSASMAMQSIEHDSAAAVAGYAYFYAATVFNNTTEPDCGFVNSNSADWDMQEGVCYDEVESPVGHRLSCAVGPTVVPQKNQRNYCAQRHIGNDPADDTSVPLDWVRFLWELQSSGTYSFTNITAYFDDAIDDGAWSATGPGVDTAFDNAGLFSLATSDESDAHGVTP